MNITLKKVLGATAAVALGLGIAGLGASAASAATEPANPGYWSGIGSPEALYIYGLMDSQRIADGATLTFTEPYFASPSATNPDQIFADAPANAEDVTFFIAPRGQESDLSKWVSRYRITFNPGTRSITNADISLNQFPSSSFAAVRASGGDFSLGFAFTANNGVTFRGLGAFNHVHIEKDTANWTFVPEGVPGGQPAAGSPGNIALEAQVIGSCTTDGAFSLAIPSGSKATLGAPVLDAANNNRSTAEGALPTFTVSDQRCLSKKGWDATTAVANFTRSGGSETIGAENLKVTPAIATGTGTTGATASAAFQASTAAAPFAQATAGNFGTTNLNAQLKFAAPANSVPGTYTSNVTVTVVSK